MTRARRTTKRTTAAAAVALALSLAPLAAARGQVPAEPGPRFRADGPNAAAYGMNEGYPRCQGLAFVRETRCRVGAFSQFDALFPARRIAASGRPSAWRRAPAEPEIAYVFAGRGHTIDSYLDRRPITGFLLAKGDTLLIERYQYGRRDTDRMASFSMAKTIVGLLVGHAVHDGAIRSLDDAAEIYVPGLAGTLYGAAPIRALLEMRSGVFFREDYADPTSDIYTLARLTLEQDPAGSLAALKRFDWRRAPPGRHFYYSSADTVALGLVVAAATRRTLADYASEKLWRPLGAEADASWIVDATGHEVAFAYVNAVLRDWARLGRMLAEGGTAEGRVVVPASWLAAMRANPIETGFERSRYGFHVWLSADGKRFLLMGLRGQTVIADPETGLVLVQTSLSSDDFLDLELFELWRAARARLR